MAEYINRDTFLEHERAWYCKDCSRRKNTRGKFVYEIGEAPCRACDIGTMLDAVEDYPAADVIEGLSGLIDHYGGETGIKNLEEYAKKYWDTLTKIPRWIPVTETLPKCEWGAEVGNIVWISCGMVFAGCFGRGGKYRDAYFRTWTDGTEGIDAKDADYWRQIQIPELPKEGT